MIKAVYAFKDTKYTNSSSGGAFPAIAEVCNGEKLVIYGAAFEDDFHISIQRAEGIKNIEKFQGSKYAYSDMSGVFKTLADDINSNKFVLFTGLPCQVMAIRKYCENNKLDMNKVLLVDIICHGAPNQKYFRDFIGWLENKKKSKLTEFSFRYQKVKWKNYPVRARFANGHEEVNTQDVRMYTTLYFTHLIMREGCYSCKFANVDRPGDITIGDFWGIETVLPDFKYKSSVSEVIVNTEQGEIFAAKLLNEADEKTIFIQKCNNPSWIKYQHNLNEPTAKPADYDQFIEDYGRMSVQQIYEKYTNGNLVGKIKFNLKKALVEAGIIKIL